MPNFLLIKFDVPRMRSFPLFIMAILSASSSASSRWWVVSKIVLFYFLIFLRIFQTFLLESGSSPDVGSSRKSISEPPIRAHANDIFLLFPPLRSHMNFCSSSSMKIFFAMSLISSSNTCSLKPLILPKYLR